MGKNTKPMLTVLVEGISSNSFRDYALSKEVSMGWVVNRLLDRVLYGELDVIGDTPSRGVARENIEHISTGLTREDVEKMIKSSISSLDIPSMDSNDIEELTRVSIEIALEPIRESVLKLQADTQSQFEAVRDELKAISDRAVEVPAAIAKTPTNSNKTKPRTGDVPDWVNSDNRRFYVKLVGNMELLDKVSEAIDSASGNNTVLAESLVVLGFHKQDGNALGSDSISRIRKVVSNLKTKPESTLPLFPK